MQKKRESLRIFKNDKLERLSHVHPITPLVVWAPIISWLIWRAVTVHEVSFGVLAVVAASALLVWTFAEYILHRFVFHFDGTAAWQKRLVFIFHGNHHDDPDDATRLVMPPVASLLLSIPFWLGFRALLGPAIGEPFFAFFLVGYLCYDYIHYSVHHFRPRTRIGKFLKQNHMLHHYASSNARWGVSSPLWDQVFGTTGRERPRAMQTHGQ